MVPCTFCAYWLRMTHTFKPSRKRDVTAAPWWYIHWREQAKKTNYILMILTGSLWDFVMDCGHWWDYLLWERGKNKPAVNLKIICFECVETGSVSSNCLVVGVNQHRWMSCWLNEVGSEGYARVCTLGDGWDLSWERRPVMKQWEAEDAL